MDIIDKTVEWIVVVVVVLAVPYEVLRSIFVLLDLRLINGLVSYIDLFLVFLLFVYHNNHYGHADKGRVFLLFFIIYCIYILGDMTIFRRYPLDRMAAVPESIFHFFRYFLLNIGCLYCAETIIRHFNYRKFVMASVIICTIPSLLYVQYVGVEAIQNFEVDKYSDNYLSGLTIGFCNAPIFVLCIFYAKKLFNKKYLSYLFAITVLSAIVYLFVSLGKRGPIFWTLVNVVICLFFTNRRRFYSLLPVAFLVSIILYINFDSIIGSMKDFAPKTGKKIESTLIKGDTNGRFDIDNPETSTFLIGIQNFESSPIWGNYFRLVTNYSTFKGHYPHNIFVEILMTMGIIGFVPFVLFLLKAFMNSSYVFSRKYTANQFAFFVLFLSSFLMLQTSRSVVFQTGFWLPFYILFIIKEIKLTDDKKRLKIYRRY